MWLKLSIVTLLFFILALLQQSFFSQVSAAWVIPNLVFILFFAVIFFEKNLTYYQAIFLAVVAGLLLDVFLTSYFGLSIIILLVIYFSFKALGHFLEEGRQGYSLFYFVPLFLIYFIFYSAVLYLFSQFPRISFSIIWLPAFIGWGCNLIAAVIVFYLYDYLSHFGKKGRQLKLF